MKLMEHMFRRSTVLLSTLAAMLMAAPMFGARLFAQEHMGGEANLVIPDLNSATFFGMGGHTLLMFGLIVCVAGLAFGMIIYTQLKNMPVHCVDARGLGADLRDLQDVSGHPGQVHSAFSRSSSAP